VESNGKTAKIVKFSGYDCIASYGHIYELKPTLKWYDDDNIEPHYQTNSKKAHVLKTLRQYAANASEVLIASDQDREGECIAANIIDYLKLDVKTTKRIRFNQITEKAIKDAIANPGTLDCNLYNAQKARAVLDILFGFTISPLLSRHLGIRGLSAGRCQTPALRLIHTRESEQFVGGEISISVCTKHKSHIIHLMRPKLHKTTIAPFLTNISGKPFKISNIRLTDKIENPCSAFTTSRLQQEVYSNFKLTPKKTMEICQKLYENGYITYHRTDSTKLSSEFTESVNRYVIQKFGTDYVGASVAVRRKTSQNTQDAHEAIRPIDIQKNDPNDEDARRVYTLIKLRAIESLMAAYKFTERKIMFSSACCTADCWQTTTTKTTFLGFKSLYKKNTEDIVDTFWDSVKIGDTFNINNEINAAETAKKPATLYNHGNFVNELENKGIGRPSTYVSIIEKLLNRKYVVVGTSKSLDIELSKWKLKNATVSEQKYVQKLGKQKGVFIMTDLGNRICDFVENSDLKSLCETNFTSEMESKLDLVANGTFDWKSLVHEFYEDMIEKVKLCKKNIKPNLKSKFLRIIHEYNDSTIGTQKTRFGFCVVRVYNDDTKKSEYASIPSKFNIDTIDETVAIEFLKNVSKIIRTYDDNISLRCKNMSYYLMKKGKKVEFISVKTDDIEKLKTLHDCIEFINLKKK